MPVTTDLTAEQHGSQRIFVTRYGNVDRKKIREELAERAAAGQITTRDERILEYLRELHVLSVDQVRRLLWPNGRPKTTYNRLNTLKNYHLLSRARVPTREMTAWGLAGEHVYSLGVGGWLWLSEEVNSDIVARSLRRDQVLHDLLVAELCVRFTEAVWQRGEPWQLTWVGEEAAAYYESTRSDEARFPVVAPDGLAILKRRQGKNTASLPLFFEVDRTREAHGRPSSDWGRKVNGYNRFYKEGWQAHPQLSNLPEFPVVAVVTHGAQRLLNLAQAIKNHRKEPVAYYLALWSDLMAGADILSTPAWLMMTPDGNIIGLEREQRAALLAAG